MITDEGCAAIARCTDLRGLCCGGRITRTGVAALARGCTELRYLELPDADLSAADLQLLGSCPHLGIETKRKKRKEEGVETKPSTASSVCEGLGDRRWCPYAVWKQQEAEERGGSFVEPKARSLGAWVRGDRNLPAGSDAAMSQQMEAAAAAMEAGRSPPDSCVQQ